MNLEGWLEFRQKVFFQLWPTEVGKYSQRAQHKQRKEAKKHGALVARVGLFQRPSYMNKGDKSSVKRKRENSRDDAEADLIGLNSRRMGSVKEGSSQMIEFSILDGCKNTVYKITLIGYEGPGSLLQCLKNEGFCILYKFQQALQIRIQTSR